MSTTERCERFASNREKAVELFARKGFAQVGMRELATCLGMAPGSLYHHYPSKRHLLLDILEEFYEELLAALAHLDSRSNNGIAEVIRAHVRLYQQLPRHFCIALRDSACLAAEQQQSVEQLRAQYETRLMRLLGLGVDFDRFAASLLSIVQAWFSGQGLEDDATCSVMEVALVGAVERVLGRPEMFVSSDTALTTR